MCVACKSFVDLLLNGGASSQILLLEDGLNCHSLFLDNATNWYSYHRSIMIRRSFPTDIILKVIPSVITTAYTINVFCIVPNIDSISYEQICGIEMAGTLISILYYNVYLIFWLAKYDF